MAADQRDRGSSVTHDIGVSRRKFLSAAGATAAGAAFLSAPSDRVQAADHAHTPKRPTCVVVEAGLQHAFSSDDDGNLIRYDIDPTANPPSNLKNPVTFTDHHAGKASYIACVGDLIATSGYDGNVLLYDRNSPQGAARVFDKHRADGNTKRQVWVVTLSKDGSRALSATNDGQILLWNTNLTGNPTLFVDSDGNATNSDPIGGLAFVPDPQGGSETMFLSTHGHGEINLWDISKQSPIYEFSHRNSHSVNTVAVSSDSKFFISGGFDMTLRVWDLASRKQTKVLQGHTNWVWRVAISPDNNWAVSASEDKRALVWKLSAPGAVIAPDTVWGPFPDGVMGVAFTASNKVVVTQNSSKSANPLSIQSF